MKISPKQNRGFAEMAAMIMVALLVGAFGFSVLNKSHTAPQAPEIPTVQQTEPSPVAGAVNTVGAPPFFLYGSGVGASDSSITLTYFYINVSKQKLRMSDFGTIGYLTLEPGNTLRQEFVSFTGITQNTDGTATLTGVSRGLSPITPYTASTTLQKTHGGGTQAIISNPPQLYELFANKNNDQTITGTWNFASTAAPRYDADPGAAYFTTAPTTVLVPLAQLNRVVLAGAVNATRAVQGLLQVAFRGQAASSTQLGSTGAFNVLTADIATSSPSISMSTSSVVMTRLDGRIDPGFFATTTGTTYTLGNLLVNWVTTLSGFLSTASSTNNATTTIAASSVTNNAIVLNTIPYKFAPTRGASSSVLTEDGSGNLGFYAPKVTVIAFGNQITYSSQAFGSLVGTTIKIPANTLSTTANVRVRITCQANNQSGGPGGPWTSLNFGNGSATTSNFVSMCHGAGPDFGFTDFEISATSSSAEVITGFKGTSDVNSGNSSVFQNASSSFSVASPMYISFFVSAGTGGQNNGGVIQNYVVESVTQ